MIYNPNLLTKTKYFNNIIFDLDNTLISLTKYDYYVYKKISELLVRKTIKRKAILKKLVILRKKEINIGKKINIFNKTFLNKKESIQAFRIYNSYYPKNFKIDKKNLYLLNHLKLQKKKIYLVTNGDTKRQLKKIQKLKIKKFFFKIYILDGKKKKFKPSTQSLSILKNQIKNQNTVMIGDSKIDKQFAKNLKVKYIKYLTI